MSRATGFTKALPLLHGQHPAMCRECDLVVRIPARSPEQRAQCPRCRHHLTGYGKKSIQPLMAWASATLIALAVVFLFPFLGFSSYGLNHVMPFSASATALFSQDYTSVALVLLLTTVVLPAVYLAAILYLGMSIGRRENLPGAIGIARILRPLEPWLMSDVFVVGVLVSLIKIVSLADIHIYSSFYAFCAYALGMLKTLTLVDWSSIWDGIAPRPAPDDELQIGSNGRKQSAISCRGCDMTFISPNHEYCPRCGKKNRQASVDRTQLTMALLVAATLLYIPANAYPIMYTELLNDRQPQTIAAGVLQLYQSGDWPVASVIFLASIMVPISKIAALFWLCRATYKPPRASLLRTRIYRVTDFIGRWSMIDVFVVAILTALVQADSLVAITPGPGIISFASVVILTMLAAHSFDTSLLWPATDDKRAGEHE